jgi:hypothetical protein
MTHAMTLFRSVRILRLTAPLCAAAVFAGTLVRSEAQEATIRIQADQVLHRVSRYLTGACIEDVNHEIYGGLYSQMLYGESFQEPPVPLPIKGFFAYGGRWGVKNGELEAEGGDGPKLVCDTAPMEAAEAGVELLFPKKTGGNAGFIVKVSEPGVGADRFVGYEIALAPSGRLVLGRHRQNFDPLREVPCEVPVNQWLALVVRMKATSFEVMLNGTNIARYEDTQHPLASGRVGLRTWRQDARFRNFWLEAGTGRHAVAFEAADNGFEGVSGMWRPARRGSAQGSFALASETPFLGRQSQRITFNSGEGEFGIENQGLNRWGVSFVQGKPYGGYVWARAAKPVELFAALESRDGFRVYAEQRLAVTNNDWERLSFNLTPNQSEKAGRFALKLKRPGSVSLGHAFLQPGDWGRFKGLPDRKDVADALVDQGITVLRYGGSMVNAAEYRWKKMIGPRDRRPPYRGTWYEYSSNGWGIPDFLNFCEAAGFLAIPDFNIDESSEDMADFVEYVNGPVESKWGRQRALDGHPFPYRLQHIELGNEERVDESYWVKFKSLAEALWAKDPQITLVVGDFAYGRRITDPWHFSGAASRITNLTAHQKILRLAKEHDREVWFDVHVGTEGPRPDSSMAGTLSFIDALGSIAEGARHQVVIFEFNAGNHSQRRALANALAINTVGRDGRMPIATSANCLQPDGQNDNGWDQGLLFLNPSQVWLQPPGYITRMISRNYQPLCVKCEVQNPGDNLDAAATRSEDGKTLVLQVVSLGSEPRPTTIRLDGFAPTRPMAKVEELAGPLDAVNTAEFPERVKAKGSDWRCGFENGQATYTFPAHSVTVIRLE